MAARVALLAWSATALGGCMPPSWGAAALLHPRRSLAHLPPEGAEALTLAGSGVRLAAARWRTPRTRRGTVIVLHGIGDNRGSAAGLAAHLGPLGFDVIAYDSRAHGESTGEDCTYGYYEKQDLRRVIDQLDGAHVVVLGTSLGGAVALQAAAEDARVIGVVALAPFSDLRTVVSERAPFFASRKNVADALRRAEAMAHFEVDAVSPVAAAARIRVPVLLLHGTADHETPPAHSRRIYDALTANRTLLEAPGAGHNNLLNGETWKPIDAWLDRTVR